MHSASVDRAAHLLAAARRPLFLTGAGMSAESGIPTFRDAGGYWRRFPPFARLGLAAQDLASPWASTSPPARRSSPSIDASARSTGNAPTAHGQKRWVTTSQRPDHEGGKGHKALLFVAFVGFVVLPSPVEPAIKGRPPEWLIALDGATLDGSF